MDLTSICHVVLSILGTLITVFLIPWLKSKLTLAEREKTSAVVKTLVNAAEQLYGAGMGADKLNYVADSLQKMGYKINVGDVTDSLRAMIEEAVRELEA